MKTSIIHWKSFWTIWGAGVIGVIAVFPYLMELQKEQLETLPLSPGIIFILSTVQSSLLIGLFTFLGLYLGKKVGLGAPLLEQLLRGVKLDINMKRYIGLAITLGVMVSGFIIVLDAVFPLLGLKLPETTDQPLWWKGFLASFYGGITEEIQIRLFFMTLLVWMLTKVKKLKETESTIWLAIFIAAIVFGMAHLPAAASVVELTPLMATRIILLNTIGGIVFGWLYWKKGLEAAIIAHFSADIVLHVLIPLLSSMR